MKCGTVGLNVLLDTLFIGHFGYDLPSQSLNPFTADPVKALRFAILV